MNVIPEQVVLVDESNKVLGTMPKSEVHGPETPLHRAFSAFLFNQKGELLLQQRSHLKKTWPMMWSNSVCGHPMLDEMNESAVERRALYELGLQVTDVRFVAPYRYKATKDGVMENEICPIYVGTVTDDPHPNPDEVEVVQWISWSDFLHEIATSPETYSIWCREEAAIIEEKRRAGLILLG